MQSVLGNLFGVFALPDSQENEYAMRAVNRVVGFLGVGVKPAAETCLERLAAMATETCKNPRNPTFSHYLFESIAALLRHANDPALVGRLSGICSRRFNTCCNRTWWSSRRTCSSFCRR